MSDTLVSRLKADEINESLDLDYKLSTIKCHESCINLIPYKFICSCFLYSAFEPESINKISDHCHWVKIVI